MQKLESDHQGGAYGRGARMLDIESELRSPRTPHGGGMPFIDQTIA